MKARFLALLMALIVALPIDAAAQQTSPDVYDPLRDPEVQFLLTTSTSIVMSIPAVIIIARVTGIPEEDLLQLSTLSAQLSEITLITLQLSDALSYIRHSRHALQQDIAVGAGPALDDLASLLKLAPNARVELYKQARERRRELHGMLDREDMDPLEVLEVMVVR